MINKNSQPKTLTMRNSTAEFLMFTFDARVDGIEVRIEDEMIWLTQKLMAELFETSVPNINMHLANIFKDDELEESSVIKDFLITATDGRYCSTESTC